MEDRRKTVGDRIRRARQVAKYSQRELAKKIDVDTSTVSHAENGSDRIAVDGKVYPRVEDEFGWPAGSIARYLESGDESVFDQPDPAEELRRTESEIWRRLMRIAEHYDYATFLAAARKIAELSQEQYERESREARESDGRIA